MEKVNIKIINSWVKINGFLLMIFSISGDDIDYSSVRIKPRPKSRMNSSPLLDFLNTQSKAKRSELVEKISSKFVSPYQKLLNYMVTTGSLK